MRTKKIQLRITIMKVCKKKTKTKEELAFLRPNLLFVAGKRSRTNMWLVDLRLALQSKENLFRFVQKQFFKVNILLLHTSYFSFLY
jgi:hypothetical protein